MYKIFFLLAITFGISTSTSAQDSTNAKYKLGFFDLTAGLDFRTSSFENYNQIYSRNSATNKIDTTNVPSGNVRRGFYEGAYFKIQHSFIATYFWKPGKRFMIGELVSAELSAGYSNSPIANKKTGFQAFYNFELGFAAIYRFSPETDFGMSIGLLKFGNEYISQIMSGSNYFVRLRHRKITTELGFISENKIYFGIFNFIDNKENLTKINVTARYLFLPQKMVGVRVDMFPLVGHFYTGSGVESTFALKIFYGINF